MSRVAPEEIREINARFGTDFDPDDDDPGQGLNTMEDYLVWLKEQEAWAADLGRQADALRAHILAALHDPAHCGVAQAVAWQDELVRIEGILAAEARLAAETGY